MGQNLNERLVDAACTGDTRQIKTLLARGADPNHDNGQINTVLMWAVTHRHIEAARLLLDAGADVNGHDMTGATALIAAAANGDTVMVRMLLEAGARAAHKDHDGNTALAWAIHNKHEETAETLRRQDSQR